MQQFIGEIKRILICICGLSAIAVLTACIHGQTSIAYGLLVGTGAGIIYFLLMCYRVHKSASLPPAKAIGYMRTGWLVRLLFVVCVLVICIRLPQVNFWAAAASLVFIHVVMLLNAIWQVARGIVASK